MGCELTNRTKVSVDHGRSHTPPDCDDHWNVANPDVPAPPPLGVRILVVSEADAAAIRAAFDQRGNLSAANRAAYNPCMTSVW
jgi:hypothetical protein